MIKLITEKIKKNLYQFSSKGNKIDKLFLYFADNVNQLKIIKPSLNNIKIKLIDKTVLKNIKSIRNESLYKRLLQYYKQGCIGLYIEHDNVIASYEWISVNKSGSPKNPNKLFSQPNNSGYIFSCYTNGDFRGKKLYSLIIKELACLALNKGVERVWTDTNDYNIPAQKGIRNAGFIYYETIRIFKILGFSLPPKVKKESLL